MNKKRVLFLIYQGFELLDLSGPTGVFSNAQVKAGETSPYSLLLVSEFGGQITSSAGFEMTSVPMREIEVDDHDTVLIVGARADALSRVLKRRAIVDWLRHIEGRCERIGSVCSGAFVLAQAGLLNHKEATTHWLSIEDLQREFPLVKVDTKALYVNDGKVWTSAGVTSGIDMALAMLRKDFGSQLMARVAKGLVLYTHRPGHQSQFSELLKTQTGVDNGFSDLVLWVSDNIDKELRVADMSSYMNMSERTFYRKFSDSMGLSPAKYLEKTRLCRAKELIENNVSQKQVMRLTGFKSAATFRKAFTSYFGLTPGVYHRIHKRR
ncbi:GlxA family transcriptional regulator [Arenicella sp. 4NH20-0111]|uniref:GlxA family transcriptional regulator n=1 Tax=Arenicella sp. 4NH20-0111 TaxID=3127648 RepID=UPI003105A86B